MADGIQLIASIVPKNDAAFATHEDTYVKGGWRAVADLTARDAIPAERRTQGMRVKVLSNDKLYDLFGGILNANWREVVGGAGTGDVVGPAGATANAVCVFDGATGKLIKEPNAAVSFGGQAITSVGTVDGRSVATDGTTLDTHVAATTNPHSTSIANIGSGTLAQLNGAVSDATLDDSSSARTPTAHASSHQNGGGDEIATATPAPNAIPKADGSGTLNSWVTATGDVTAAANLADNTLIRGDNPTPGKGVQSSGITLDDSDNMTFPSGGSLSVPGVGANSERFGSGAAAAGNSGTAIGNGAGANGADTTVVGSGSSAADDNVTIVGESVTIGATITGVAVVGRAITVNGLNSAAVGDGATVTTLGAVVGAGASITGDRGAAVGWTATAAQYSTAVGGGASAAGTGNVSVGRNSNSGTGFSNTAVGNGSLCGSNNCTSVGQGANAAALRTTVVGANCSALAQLTVVMGRSASADAASADSVVGGDAATATNSQGSVIWGKNATATNALNAIGLGSGITITHTRAGAFGAGASSRRNGAATFGVWGNATSAMDLDPSGDLTMGHRLLNAQETRIKAATTELSGLTGASVTATNLIPAGAVLVGVSARVTTAITGATSFDVGDGSDVDRWGAGIAVALGTTSDNTDWTAGTIECFPTAQDVVLTANGSNFTAGAVRLTVHYIDIVAPSS